MTNLIDLNNPLLEPVLSTLLLDRTTEQNILWATNSYADYGEGFQAEDRIKPELLISCKQNLIQPRVYKDAAAQQERTKNRAEVYTPSWVVNLMNNYCDEEWFGRPDVFNIQRGKDWEIVSDKIAFPEGKTWQDYIDSTRLEITCGEAPYIVSRYDVTTGIIIPLERRIGLLDRKLRIVNENASAEEEWLEWTLRAFQSVYGYEFQGDNLLVARINLLNTYTDYMTAQLRRQPSLSELQKIADVITWNFWQMDGFTCTIPYAEPETEETEQTAFEGFFDTGLEEPKNIQPVCLIRDWREAGEGGKAHKITELKR